MNALLCLCALGLSITLALRMRSTHKSSLEYLEGKDLVTISLKTFICRSLIVLKSFFIIIVFVFVFYCVSFYLIDKFILEEKLPIFIYSVICIAPVSINGLGILVTLLIVLFLTCIIWMLHTLLKLLEWGCWKIVQSYKGVAPAIIILLNVVLGILGICLK
jgi:hypothetical protein